MKITRSLRKFLTILLVGMLTLAFGGLFACQADTDKYSIETDKTEMLFYYQEEFNFEEYFENTYLKITKEDGEEYLIDFENYMFTEEIDTSSVGEKSIELSYNNKSITFTYFVKYKVDFLVDGEIYESQYVLTADELDLTKIPTKTGFTFVGWEEIDGEITNNVTLNANFIKNKTSLQFNIEQSSFEYDGTEKKPIYSFTGVDNETVNVKYELIGYETAKDVGTYNYMLTIEDDNYEGEYFGEFEITKKPIKVEISTEEMVYGTTVPTFTVNVYNADGNILEDSLKGQLNLSTNAPIFPQAGEHEIDLVNKTYSNFNLTEIEKGKLVVNKATHGVDVSILEEKAVYGTILTKEDLVSTNNEIGSWAFATENVQILTANTFTTKVLFTPFDTKNYNSIEKEITFNVAKKPVEIKLINNEFTYDGEEKLVSYVVEGVLDNDFNVEDNIAKTNAGSYDINLVLKSEKYFAEDLKTKLIINKANKAEFTFVQSNLEEITYNEQSARILKDITLPNGYTWANAEQLLLIGENNYQVVYTPEDTNNFNVEKAELKLKVNKAQGEIIVNVAENGEYTFNSTYQYDFSASVNNNEQTIKYSYLYNGEPTNALKDSGNYVVTITLEETEHYLGATKEVNIQVLQVQNQDEVVSTINAIYLDTLEKFVNVLPTSSYGEWTWQNTLTTKVGNVGENTFNAVFTPYNTINYASRVVEVKFNVGKLGISAPTLSASTFTYTGKTQKPTVAVNDLYKIVNEGGVNVGTYEVVVSLVDNLNYKWVNGNSEDITLTYEIVKATNSFTLNPNLNKTTWVYGEEQGAISIGTAKFGNVEVFFVDGENNQYNVMPTNAGEYKAIFSVAETENYYGLKTEITFVIEKARVDIPTLTEKSFIYNSELQKPIIEESDLYTIVNNGGVNVGTYQVVISLADTSNYNWSKGNIEDITYIYAIEKAIVEIPTISEKTFVYTGETQKPTILESKLYTIVNNGGVNVGTYQVVISLADTSNYNWSKGNIEDITYTYYIEKAIVEVPNNVFETYTGEKLTANIKNTSLYQVIENNGGVEVGEYVVKIKLIDSINYRWATTESDVVNVKFFIQKNGENGWVIEPTIIGWVYGDVKNQPKYESKLGDVIINYVGINGTSYENKELPTNVGEYKAIFTVVGTENYTGLEEVEITFTISKASVEIPTINKNTFVYTGELQKPIIEESQLYTIVSKGGVNVGTYKVIISLADSTNYNWSNGNIEDITYTFEINKAVVELPTINKNTFVYNGELQKPIIEESDLYTIVNNGGVNVGTYQVVISLADTSNYNWSKGNIEDITYIYAIEKAIVEIPTISEKTFVYTGETQKPTILESKLYTIVNNGGVNVGTYQVVISLADSTNYNWSNGNIEDITYTYYIEKATNEFTLNPNLSKITWVYGEEQGVATLGKSTFGNVSVVYVDGENNQYNVIPTNAGEYKAVFSVVGTENYYYLEAEIIFVIKKASVNLPTSPQNKSYTGSKLVADVVENSLYTIVNNGGVNVGEYNVTYTLKNDVNYKWADEKEGATRTYVFAITKATNSWALNPSISKNTWAYGEEAGVLNIGNASFGMPNIKYIDQNNKEYKEAPTNVGTYRAVVSVVGTENYTALTTTINFTIEKVILTITAPQFVDTIFYENKVDLNNESNFVALPTIDKNVLGEFVYELPLGQQIEDGKVKVKVTFITVDSVNYQVASEVYATINVKTVATIGSVNYGSIESALLNAVSGDVVWVTAGDVNIEITSDCEILSDVILNIPYEGKDMNSNGKAELTDKTVNNINALTVVTVKENVTLTNYGTIQVTGQLSGGGGGGAYAGHTAGKTAKVVLKANAIINNVGGTIKLFGLILESYNDNGSQVIIDGGNLYMPFVVRDFRGGSYMYAVYDNKQATAFNEFELRNITSLVTVKNSANVYGYANLATSKLIGSGTQQNATTINLVSTNSTAIIHFANNNGYLTSKYNITDDGYTGGDTWADGILDLDIFGGATAEAMSLKVNTGLGNTTVSTENVFFPISWRLNISLNGLDGEECNYTMNYKYKIMPGGVFTVGEGANLTIKTLAVYTQQAITDVNDISTGLTLPYSETVGDGQFIVETGGSVTITKGNVGGAIKVVEGGSFVNNGTSSVTAYEVKELTGSSIFANCKVENINLSLTLV